jgi:hypothetical protein
VQQLNCNGSQFGGPIGEDFLEMLWNRSTSIGIANAACTACQGIGIILDRHDAEAPCRCTLRAVFRSCFRCFAECVALGERTASVSWEPCYGPIGGRIFSRKREEFIADFLGVAQRTLTECEYRIFRYTFLLGADYILCCQKLEMDRGTFFHTLYDIEEKLGRVYAELEPYPLYPLRDYFGGLIHKQAAAARVLRTRVSMVVPLSA